MIALAFIFDVIVLSPGDFLTFKPLIYLVPVGKQDKEGRAFRLSHNDRP